MTFLGLGSNLGDRTAHLAYGLRQLQAHGGITAVSSVYESDPVGYTDQPRFLNMVAGFRTTLSPRSLLDAVLHIERRRGRTRAFRNAPRTLDIDILTLERVIDEDGLTVPHPRLVERSFTLVPLLEVAPGLADLRSGRPYAEFLAAMLAERGIDTDHIGTGPDGDAALDALGLSRVMDGWALLEDGNGDSDGSNDDDA